MSWQFTSASDKKANKSFNIRKKKIKWQRQKQNISPDEWTLFPKWIVVMSKAHVQPTSSNTTVVVAIVLVHGGRIIYYKLHPSPPHLHPQLLSESKDWNWATEVLEFLHRPGLNIGLHEHTNQTKLELSACRVLIRASWGRLRPAGIVNMSMLCTV